MTVESKEEAKEVSRMLAESSADPRDVNVGDRVEEPACVMQPFPERLRGEDGLPCPRTTLDHDNALAVPLIRASINEELRGLSGAVFESVTRYMDDDERAALLDRVIAALSDGGVVDIRSRNLEARLAKDRAAREGAQRG